MRRGRAVAAGVGALLLAARGVSAVEIEGVLYDDEISVGGRTLQLRGAGLLRYRVFLKAYVAALYLPRGEKATGVLGDVPRRLEIEYFWSIDAADFGAAAEALLERALDERALAGLRERLDRLHSWYEDIEPGDRYALTYQPGVGTELAKNGRPLGVIRGRDFAEAYFAIWLGDEPLDESLREDLLGAG